MLTETQAIDFFKRELRELAKDKKFAAKLSGLKESIVALNKQIETTKRICAAILGEETARLMGEERGL